MSQKKSNGEFGFNDDYKKLLLKTVLCSFEFYQEKNKICPILFLVNVFTYQLGERERLAEWTELKAVKI